MAAAAIRGEYSSRGVAGKEADSSSDDDPLSSASSDASGSMSLAAKSTAASAGGQSATASEGTADGSFRRQQMQAKRYKRQSVTTSAAASVAAPTLNQQQQKLSATKRRILRKDHRTTLDMLTSDDDVNQYSETRPSSYMEPAARRTMHEEKPHLKSSFETLYNPELNQPFEDPEQLSLSLSSSCDSLDAVATATRSQSDARKVARKSLVTWQLASGPMLSPKAASSYLDVTQSSRGKDVVERSDLKQETIKAPAPHEDSLDKEERAKKPIIQTDTSGVIWTEFGAPELHELELRNDPTKAKSLETFGQPLNVNIQESKRNIPGSRNAQAITAIGIDVRLELGGNAVKSSSEVATQDSTAEIVAVASQNKETAAKAEDTGEQPRWAKLPAWMLLLPDKVSPRKPDPANGSDRTQPAGVSPVVSAAGAVEKPRGKRILPAVPDSADLEVTDLLRETHEAGPSDRPKSAVDILVSKSRSSSILQMQSQPDANQMPTVSQQLRSLFHNPSPLIMLHRAATRPTPPPPPLPQPDNSEYLSQQQTNRYMPLRVAQHRSDGGNGSASSLLLPTNHRPLQESLRSDREPVQPPELPFRRNRSLLPSQRLQQESLQPQNFAHTAAPPTQPPVPPRQVRSMIARQQSPSTFFPNKLQLVSNSSSTGPPTVARSSRREVVQDFGQNTTTKSRELHSVDQLYKRVLVSPAQPAKQPVIIRSPELNGDDLGEYLLARNPSPAEEIRLIAATTSLAPTRIQTNPHLGSRPRDSIIRREEESGDERETEPRIAKSNDSVLDLSLNLASLMVSKENKGEGSLTLTTTSTIGEDQRLLQNQPTVSSTRRVMDSVQRLNQLTQSMSHTLGGPSVQHTSARDRLFRNSASSTGGKVNLVTNSQPAVKEAISSASVENDTPPRNAGSVTKPQATTSPKLALRNGKEVRMPPNAVRVLPRVDDSELQQRMRTIGSRTTGWSPRAQSDDAVAGLEKMCRDMRLEDEGLLDGAERHDTPIRVQVRMDALKVRAPAVAAAGSSDVHGNQLMSPMGSTSERPYYVQHRGIFPFNRVIDDQAKRFQADSDRRNNTMAKSQPHMLLKSAGTLVVQQTMVSPQTASTAARNQNRQQHDEMHRNQSKCSQLLHPGEREEGPEMFI